ncbi:MAG: insulinase family protein [Holosporales bacterium]|jgi:zinc protease|nr:insulinase family protein [Holosporales bacterium]
MNKVSLFKTYALVLLVWGGGIPTLCAEEKPAAEKTNSVQEASDHPAAAVQELVSKNGIKIWLYEDQRTPIVAVKIRFVGLGSAFEPTDQKGRTEVLARTMCDGAGKFDKLGLKRALLNLGVRLNFWASNDDMFCDITSFRSSLSKTIDIIRDIIANPAFRDKHVKIAVNQLCDEHKSLIETPEYLARKTLVGTAFPDHPYGLLPTEETYKRVNSRVLRDFWSRAISAQNVFVVLVGKISAKEATELVDLIFAELPAVGSVKTIAKVSPRYFNELKIVQNDVKQSIVVFFSQGIPASHPNYIAYQAANVMLGGPFCSRLFKKVRDSEGLVYYVNTRIKHYAYADILVGTSETANETAYTVVNMIKDVFYKLKFDASEQDNSKITDEELAIAKGVLLKDYLRAFSNPDALSAHLMDIRIANLPSSYLHEYPDKVRALTLGDVRNVFTNKLIDPDKLTAIIVGKPILTSPPAQSK